MIATILCLTLTTLGSRPNDVTQATGTVLDSTGKPVANASIFAYWAGDIERTAFAETTTDQYGRYSIGVQSRVGFDALIMALSPSGEVGVVSPKAEPADMRLLPSGTSRASFVDPDGKPVAGLRVEIELISRWPQKPEDASQLPFLVFPTQMMSKTAVTTDANGWVAYNSPLGWKAHLKVRDPHWTQLDFRSAVEAGTVVSDIKLTPAAAISGTVTDANGTPVPGVRVGAQGTDGKGYGWGLATTDAGGRYEITQLAPDTYNVAFSLTEDQEKQWTGVAREGLQVEIGSTTQHIDLKLIAGCLLKGVVLGPDKAPLKGVRVAIYGPAHPQSGAWVQATLTDDNGHYQMRVPPGKQYIYLMGRQSALIGRAFEDGHNIQVGSGPSQVFDFRAK